MRTKKSDLIVISEEVFPGYNYRKKVFDTHTAIDSANPRCPTNIFMADVNKKFITVNTNRRHNKTLFFHGSSRLLLTSYDVTTMKYH